MGNRLSETTITGTTDYAYDNANRLTDAGGVSYTWDGNGNLLDDGVKTYTYTTTTGQHKYTGIISDLYRYNGLGALDTRR